MAEPHATDIVAPVRGMHCAACVGKVERALTSVPGVDQASVNLATEQATVSFDPARTSVDALQAAVAAAGYELAEPRTGAGPVDDAAQSAREAEQRSQRKPPDRGRRALGSRAGRWNGPPPAVGAGGAPESLGPAGAHDPGSVLGRLAVSSRVPARPSLPERVHVDPRVGRDERRVPLQCGGDALAPCVPAARGHDVLRRERGRHHPGRARALARGARPRANLRGDSAAGQPCPAHGPDRAEWRRGGRADRRRAGRRLRPHPSGRAGPRRRGRHRGRFHGRRVDADRREPARRQNAGFEGAGGHGQPHRELRLPRGACRERDGAGADRQARRRRAGLARPDPAAGRSSRRGLRPDRARARDPDVSRVVGLRSRAVGALRAHQRGGRSRHRVPVRHGARDSDGDHGGHGPRRRARDPREERDRPRAARSRQHDRVRQDRHVDGRSARGDRCDHRGRRRAGRGRDPGARGGRRARLRAPGGRGDRGARERARPCAAADQRVHDGRRARGSTRWRPTAVSFSATAR